MSKYLLGIDCGTTILKVNLFDNKGLSLYDESMKNPITISGRSIGIDMEKLWEHIVILINKILETSKISPTEIISIGVCGQGEGLWALDKNLKPVQEAILWNDSRAHNLVKELKKDPNFIKEIKGITGSYIFGGGTNLLLKYMKEENPEVYENIKYIMFCKDYIKFKLTGEISSEYSDMSTSLLDLKTGKVSNKMLELMGIEDAIDLIPPIKKSYDSGGNVTVEAGKLTGLAPGTPVGMGMLDVVSTLSGIGAIKDGDVSVIIGTTISCGTVRYDMDHFFRSPGYEMHFLDSAYLEVLSTMSGAANLEWAIDSLYKEKREELGNKIYDFIESEVMKTPPGAEGLIYHPYISESGEREPFSDLNARAQFIGLSSNKGKEYMIRAVMEGVALAIRDCMVQTHRGEYVFDPGHTIFLTGGGSKSNIWGQIIADVTGRTIKVLEGGDFTCRGAAILSMTAAGKSLQDVFDVYDSYSVKAEYLPREENYKMYEEMYKIYKNLRVTMQENFWEEIKIVRDKSKNLGGNK